MIVEQCNHFNDPCAGSGGDTTPYLNAHKPVLNAEDTQDGETTATFCPADARAGIIGALFDVNLGGGTYGPSAPVGAVTAGGIGSAGGSSSGAGGMGGSGGSAASGRDGRTARVPANIKCRR